MRFYIMRAAAQISSLKETSMKRHGIRLTSRIVYGLGVLVLFQCAAHGQTLALSPQSLNVGSVLPGQPYVATITASRLGVDPLTAQVSVQSGSVSSINPTTFTLSATSPNTISIQVNAIAPTTL